MDHSSQFYAAIILTTLAGLSTIIGSAIAVFYRSPGPRFMSFTLGFSAGVMILVSFVELLGKGIDSIGFGYAHIAFFLGIAVMFCIDYFLPHDYIMETVVPDEHSRLRKASVLVALGIAIHNFPEGMATFAGTLQSYDTGVALAAAIALHNIPEGIAVAMPLYAATGSVKTAFKWSALSGLTEPAGAIIAGTLLYAFLNDFTIGWTLSMVAGFMVFISLDELLPVAHSYAKEHLAILGVSAGMALMAFSLWLLA
ncbi:MAG: zinc transporter ZupT [Deltaproteobacteria bacterium]|nr:zinc transporter ZupT [Deltaproteobacteria bacterium]